MGKILKRPTVTVLIKHPRRPYKIRCHQHPDAPDLVAVRLTKGFCRVLHAPSGLTLADADEAEVAEEFILAMIDKRAEDVQLADAYDRLTWDKFMAHTSGQKPDDQIQYIIDTTKFYTRRLGYVSSKVTADCRYKYTPEYIT